MTWRCSNSLGRPVRDFHQGPVLTQPLQRGLDSRVFHIETAYNKLFEPGVGH